MGGRDHSVTCGVCGFQRGGLDDLECDCTTSQSRPHRTTAQESGPVLGRDAVGSLLEQIAEMSADLVALEDERDDLRAKLQAMHRRAQRAEAWLKVAADAVERGCHPSQARRKEAAANAMRNGERMTEGRNCDLWVALHMMVKDGRLPEAPAGEAEALRQRLRILHGDEGDERSLLSTVVGFMSDLSETCLCAGWESGTSRACWEAGHGNLDEPYPWGIYHVDPEERRRLAGMRELLGGRWVDWKDGPVFCEPPKEGA